MVIAPLTFGTLIYTDSSNSGNLNSIFFIAFFFSTTLSLFTVIYLKRIGKISDLDASIREQRIEPLVLGTIYHAVGFILLRLSNAAPIVQGLMFCYAFNTAIVWFITRKWKISIHAIGLAGPMMALWLHGFYFPIPMGLALVLVSMSRVILKAHTPIEVTAGVILGMGLTLIELQFLFL